jgi:predicted transcriptional regulator
MSDRVFDALGDPTRRRLIEQLGTHGPGSATQLAGRLPMSRQAVAKHLAQLEEAGLVCRTRNGRAVEFHLISSGLGEVANWSQRVGQEWTERLSRLGGGG